MNDIEDINSIKALVNEFYGKVQADELIGPVFNSVIKDWEPHLNKMYSFWNAVLFGAAGFKGNPFARHMPLKLKPEHFKRWLELFYQTTDSLFKGPVAEDAKHRAELMAVMFQSKIDRTNGDVQKVIV